MLYLSVNHEIIILIFHSKLENLFVYINRKLSCRYKHFCIKINGKRTILLNLTNFHFWFDSNLTRILCSYCFIYFFWVNSWENKSNILSLSKTFSLQTELFLKKSHFNKFFFNFCILSCSFS